MILKNPDSIAATFAKFAQGIDIHALPEAVLERAKLAVLDTIGVGLAAVDYDFAQTTSNALQRLGGAGESPVIGQALRLPLRDAALLNGVLVHGLDFDDTHSDSVVHCSASAVPTVLACALANGATGREALAAYLLAIEVDARIGAIARGSLQQAGWHPTGLVGAFGAAAAAAYLLNIDATAFTAALGIAWSCASGNLEFLTDGAWTKRLHPGWAAVAGITAAHLAKAGFIGPQQPIEGRFGLVNLLLGEDHQWNPSDVTQGLGDTWEVMNISFKPYPACHLIHAFADCALALRAQHRLDPDRIQHVEALIHPHAVPVVCEPPATKLAPANAYDAQFSLYYLLAATLIRGRFGLDELTADALADPAIRALARRVSYAPDPDSAYPTAYSGAIEITTDDGRTLSYRQQVNRGARENPLSEDDVVEKFNVNAARSCDAARARQIKEAILNLDSAADLGAFANAICIA